MITRTIRITKPSVGFYDNWDMPAKREPVIDPQSDITIKDMVKTAHALGREVKIKLIPRR